MKKSFGLSRKIINFILQIVFAFSVISPAAANDENFPWEVFLPAIMAQPRCNSKNLSLCNTVLDCYNNSGYWYSNRCKSLSNISILTTLNGRD